MQDGYVAISGDLQSTDPFAENALIESYLSRRSGSLNSLEVWAPFIGLFWVVCATSPVDLEIFILGLFPLVQGRRINVKLPKVR